MDAKETLKRALSAWELTTKKAAALTKGDFVILDPNTMLEVLGKGGRQGSAGNPNETFISYDNGKVEVYTNEEFLVATLRPPQKRKPATRGGSEEPGFGAPGHG